MSELPPPPADMRGGSAAPHDEMARDGRSVSFYLAIFLGLLLLVSGGLNLLLMVVAVSSAELGQLTKVGEDEGNWEVVAVGGDADSGDRLLIVPIEGAIAEQRSPVIGATGGTLSQVKRALKLATRDDSIKGILLEVNSPGGGVTDSDLIWRELREFRSEQGKPIVALFGDTAASGGYYIAAAADLIMARPTTITGSIGVIVNNLNLSGAAEKFGITQDAIMSERTPYKDMLSPFRPAEEDEKAILRSIIDEMYDRFVDIVDEGRPGLTREQVMTLADGRVYSAKQALDNGLIDHIGFRDDAHKELMKLAGIESARLIEQRRRATLGDLFGFGASTSVDIGLASLLTGPSGSRFLYYWPGAR